jgi:hypothetical protein
MTPEVEAMASGAPTPTMGIFERINIGAFLLWVMALAVVLLRAERSTTPDASRPRVAPAGLGGLPRQSRSAS